MTKPGTLVLAVLAAAAMGLALTRGPAAAQVVAPAEAPGAGRPAGPVAEPCTFDRCGLRLQGASVFQGLHDERVGGIRSIYTDLRILETAGDSAAYLARVAAYAHHRSAMARGLSTIAMLPLYAFYLPGWHDDRDYSDAAVWTHAGLAAAGITLAILGNHWGGPVEGSLSRAIWWYNRDVVEGRVDDGPSELPPLNPDHFGHSGLLWGAGLAMLGGVIIARDDLERGAALFELVGLPLAGAGVGWLIGRGIERR